MDEITTNVNFLRIPLHFLFIISSFISTNFLNSECPISNVLFGALMLIDFEEVSKEAVKSPMLGASEVVRCDRDIFIYTEICFRFSLTRNSIRLAILLVVRVFHFVFYSLT